MRTLKIYNTLTAFVASEDNSYTTCAEEYADELYEALKNDDTDLAEYADDYHGATYYKKLHKITMSVDWVGRKLYGLATCEVDDDWTDDDTAQLKRPVRKLSFISIQNLCMVKNYVKILLLSANVSKPLFEVSEQV